MNTGRPFLALLLLGVLAALVLPPLLFLARASLFSADGALSLAAFRAVLDQPGFGQSVANSFAFAAGAALLAVSAGALVAWLVERTNAPFKPLAHLTTIVALTTPSIINVGAWLMLLGRAGPVNAWYRQLTGIRAPLVNPYSLGAMIFVESLIWAPMVFLLVGATLRQFNPELEEAARMSGASSLAILRRVTLKLALPSMLATAMLVFVRALEAFEVPALLGIPGHVRMMTTDIYQTLQTIPPDFSFASAISVLLLGVVAVLLWIYARLTRSAEQFTTVTGKNFRPAQFDLGAWRWLGGGVILLHFTLLLALPAAALLWASLLPFYQVFSLAALSRLTLANYAHVLDSSRTYQLIGNTLLIAFISATLVMLTGSLIAWLKVRRASWSGLIDTLATLPLVFPGIILAVAVMQLFLAIPIGIYGTVWIIIWGFLINAMPYGVRYAFAGMVQLHKELEEAAIMSGATTITALRRIVLPLLSPSLFAGWVFIFLLCTRVLSLPVLLAGPSSQTLAVAMFDLLGNGQATELSALGLMWSLGMTLLVLAIRRTLRGQGIGIQSH